MKKLIKDGLILRTVKIKIIILGLLGIFLSCNAQKKAAANQKSESDGSLTLLLQDNYSGSDSVTTLVIRNPKVLHTFFSKINRTRKPGLSVPNIDFSKEMVVIFCNGLQKGSQLPELYIAEELPNELILGVQFQEDTTGTAVTSPFCMYKLPLTKKEIIFEDQRFNR